jgi:DcaP outer membrane protein
MRLTLIAALLAGAAWLPAATAADEPPAPVIAPATSGDAKATKENPARLEISGKVQLDMIYDFKRVDPTWNSTLRPSTIPINCPGDPGCGVDGETVFSVRQTAIAFNGYVPTSMGELKTEISLDLFNVGGANTAFRLLHAWAELGKFGFGQYYSLMMNIDVFPNSIDYWGPSGMLFVRNPQLRYTAFKTKESRLVFSLEAPNAAIDTGKVTVADPSLSVEGWTKYPDLVGKYSMERDWGFFEIGGILRSVGYQTTSTASGNPSGAKTGWGITVDGVYRIGSGSRITGQLTFGEGMASYFNDGGVDLAPGAGFQAEAVESVGLMLFYDHRWNKEWTSSIGYSQHEQTNTVGQFFNAFKQGSYSLVNLLWSPAKNMTVGGELLWGQKEQKDGQSADDVRVQFSTQYKF